jgi:hypothetical protein
LEDNIPSCSVGGSGVQCRYCGGNWEVGYPCPLVARDPWPRGLVGVPNTFWITGAEAPAIDQWRDWGCDWANNAPNCPQPDKYKNGIYVSGAYANLAWISVPESTSWDMGDREWNVGKVSDDIVSPYSGHSGRNVSTIMGDLTIRNTRQGVTVTHIYETSSYGLTENGPDNNWPAYQVRLTTGWRLVANFKYKTRTVETTYTCTDNVGTQVECVCDPGWPGCNIVSKVEEKFNVDTEHTGPSLVYYMTREGAKVDRDAARSGLCAAIPIAIVQTQSTLAK